MLNKETYIVKSLYSPSLFRGPATGKLYISPNWIEVPEGTTMDQIIHIKPETRKVEVVKQFKSSKGDITYNVTYDGKEYKCDCPGAKYRNRICKHIKQLT